MVVDPVDVVLVDCVDVAVRRTVDVVVLGAGRTRRRRRTGARGRLDGRLDRLEIGLDLADLARGQAQARQDGRLVVLDGRGGRGPAQRPFPDRLQVILELADRRMRGLRPTETSLL